jgi:pimeloyl-ACP methyl ester carboxylesterase
LPQFITEIDGLDIHFTHVRSKHENALPLIVTHGWPGSVIEQLKIIDPLTNPTAHGLSASDAFHLVIPSLPGYGFSVKPTTTGWGPDRTARAWVVMKRLGLKRTGLPVFARPNTMCRSRLWNRNTILAEVACDTALSSPTFHDPLKPH